MSIWVVVRWIAIGQVIIPCLRKQDKRFGVSRINRIERALFNNQIGYRGYAAEFFFGKVLPYSCGAKESNTTENRRLEEEADEDRKRRHPHGCA